MGAADTEPQDSQTQKSTPLQKPQNPKTPKPQKPQKPKKLNPDSTNHTPVSRPGQFTGGQA